jgi:quercetin dioxygenase-like cupin family protein
MARSETMTFFADKVGTAMINVDALPWIPFLPYSDQIFIKIIKLNPINGEWISLLKLPGGVELPKHHHAGTVHVYTVEGRWRYKEHDWIAGPGSFVFETAASAHTPIAEPGPDVVTLNIVVGDWNIIDETGAVLAVENWRSMLARYKDHCAAHGLATVDITGFDGN